MAGVAARAVVFDYGLTLVGFSRPAEAIDRAQAEIARRIAAAGHDAPSPGRLREAVHDRVEAEVVANEESGSLDEVDIVALERRAFADIGLHLDDALLDDCSRLVQEAWLEGVTLYDDVVPTLELLRGRGLRLGVCSNAAYRPASLRAQLVHLGLDRLLDAAVFSSEVGRRKPATDIFTAALAALGADAATTVFVGDRVREDVGGSHEAGMRPVLIDRNRSTAGRDVAGGVPHDVIHGLRELPPLLGLEIAIAYDGRNC